MNIPYDPITKEDVKYHTKEQLIRYIAELEFSIMQLQGVLSHIVYKTSQLSQLGFELEGELMNKVVSNAYKSIGKSLA